MPLTTPSSTAPTGLADSVTIASTKSSPTRAPPGSKAWRSLIGRHLKRLASFEIGALSPENAVDAHLLANALECFAYELDELREHTWNPMEANPGRAIYELTAREFAPPADRLGSIAGRLASIPNSLATARAGLGTMPRVHLETALIQFAGTSALIVREIDRLLERSPLSRAEIDAVRPGALEAIETHMAWLHDRLAASARDDSFRDPRIGTEHFSRKLSLALDAESDAASILARAEADLEAVTEEIIEAASKRLSRRPSPQLVREALDALGSDSADNDTILALAGSALRAQIAFVQDLALVSTYDDPFELIPMPEIDRGIAVAYCDAPGALEDSEDPDVPGCLSDPGGLERATLGVVLP